MGRNLAKRLRRRFVDLDRLIEKRDGMKVREIFELKGEPYFRELEKQTLADLVQQPGPGNCHRRRRDHGRGKSSIAQR